jgi:hypothetical protein
MTKTPDEMADKNKGENMNEITINGETYRKVQADLSSYFIIRTYSAGVHFGIITQRDGKEVTLKDARRIWYWEGAASLSQMAVDGVIKPKSCKFSVTTPKIILTEAIEIIPCTEKAAKCILEVPEWKA